MKESSLQHYSEITSVASGYSSHRFWLFFVFLLDISAEYKHLVNPGLERALQWVLKEQCRPCFSRGTFARNVVACASTSASEIKEMCYVLGLGTFGFLKGNLKEIIVK